MDHAAAHSMGCSTLHRDQHGCMGCSTLHGPRCSTLHVLQHIAWLTSQHIAWNAAPCIKCSTVHKSQHIAWDAARCIDCSMLHGSRYSTQHGLQHAAQRSAWLHGAQRSCMCCSMAQIAAGLHASPRGCMGLSMDCSALHGLQRRDGSRVHGLQHGCREISTAAWNAGRLHRSDHSTAQGWQLKSQHAAWRSAWVPALQDGLQRAAWIAAERRGSGCSTLHGTLHAAGRSAWLHGLQHGCMGWIAAHCTEHSSAGCMGCSTAAWIAEQIHGLHHRCMDCSTDAWAAEQMHELQHRCMDYRTDA